MARTRYLKRNAVATSQEFQERVRMCFTEVAVREVNGFNSAVADFSKRVLNGSVNWVQIASAVASAEPMHQPIEAIVMEKSGSVPALPEDQGVTDALLMQVVSGGQEGPQAGVFFKMAIATR